MTPRRGRPVAFHLARLGLLATLPGLATCDSIVDLCTPQHADYGFFSRGDCIFTRSSTFQGHEWLTVLGNRELDPTHRFTDEQSEKIAEGNRRVDWPKEILIQMNSGVISYMNALTDYTNEPQRQVDHFLLSDRDTEEEAVAGARAKIRMLTAEAVRYATTDEERALVAIGRANHLIQDSYSNAHSRRDVDNPTNPGCVSKIKAYIKRAPGFDTPDIEYHGDPDLVANDDEDDDDENEDERGEHGDVLGEGIGHTTTQDSIYRQGRDCRSPSTADGVESCLSDAAKRARDATRDYLFLVGGLSQTLAGTEDLESSPEAKSAVEQFIATHLTMCPP